MASETPESCKINISTGFPESPRKKKQSPSPPVAATPLGVLDSKFVSFLPALGFAFMTYNAVEALYQARNDPWTVAFVVSAYADLLLLFWCLREFEKIPERKSPKKDRLKIAIWTLAMALNVMFSYRVTIILDSTVMSIIIWGIAALTTVGGFYGLFCCPDLPPAAAPSPVVAVASNKV